jgi:hypothetical protein
MTTTPAVSPTRRGLSWPAAIIIGFLLMVVVNAAFIYIAVSGADPVVPSYTTEGR